MRVVLRVPRPLVNLLATIDGVATTVADDDPLPPHDVSLPLLSIAGTLGVDARSIPNEVPYLHASSALRANAARVVAARRARLNVGVAWAGNREHPNDRRRSVPLSLLAPLFDVSGVSWFSLQKGADNEQWASLPVARAIAPLPADYALDDTAALIAELDLVVSVDTAIAHLAGALARPTWLLLPFSADWRWGIDRRDSPWYPTMRLFRQPSIGDWSSVIAEVVRSLC
jgi:hypothetical protein